MIAWIELRAALGVLPCGCPDSAEVVGIADDSRKIKPGFVFLSMAGLEGAGLRHAEEALAKGALAILSAESAPHSALQERWCRVGDMAVARQQVAKTFYRDPFAQLLCHGVTGTNGKTTTTYIQERLLAAAGETCALIGTVAMRIGKSQSASQLTTPGLLELYAFAQQAVRVGCRHLVMEVSSHALDQGRVAGMLFHRSLFSNLTQDHLDYHREIELYFAAKRRLFMDYLGGEAVVNLDNAYGGRLFEELRNQGVPCLGVSRRGARGAHLQPAEIICDDKGISLLLAGTTQHLHSNLRGDFNADNLMLALGWGRSLGLDLSQMANGIRDVYVPGRLEMAYDDGKRRVVVDYAHTPDALERVLQATRALCRGRLVVLFGCGGDRDRGKRPLMGAVAESLADFCWVTSDNPRTEDPVVILGEILEGMQGQRHTVIADRREAIQAACSSLQEGDWLVVAGKGHEDYQILGTEKVHFDDRDEVREALRV